MTSPVERQSYSKINLGLEILRKRPDGFHDLETIYYRCSLADTLTFEVSDRNLTLESDAQALSVGPDNLCLRAAEALRAAAGGDRGAHIVLKKQIPIGAGLGGGSSNAAVVLQTLNELWGLHLPASRLFQIASTLGSDVPFFLGGPLSFGSGRGEILESLSVQYPYWTATHVPEVHVSTRWAYDHLQLVQRTRRESLRDRFLTNVSDIKRLKSELVNDFEGAVFASFPATRHAADLLKESGCDVVLMSGSGSAVFGLSPSRSIIEKAAAMATGRTIAFITPPLES